MNAKKKPELRFKGFDGEWERNTLGKITDVYDGTHQTPKYIESGVMFISVEDIQTLQSKKYISEDAFARDFPIYPEKGDVLMTRIGDVGTANIVTNDSKMAYYVSLALFKIKNLYSYFLKESLHSYPVKKDIWHRTLHIAFPKKINKNEIEKVSISYPYEYSEQAKIGDFFKNIDSLISLSQRKYDKLVNVKKACLEKMFPKNGADTPEIRFKGFGEKWERKEFGSMYEKSCLKNDLRYGIGNIISVANMYFKNNIYISDPEYLKTYNIFKLGDIAFEGNKSNEFANGRFVENTIGDGIVSHVFDVFKPKTSKYDLQFWKYAINNEQLMGKILVRCTKSSTMMTNLVTSDFLKESFLVPNIDEQTKIGTFFQNLDRLISLRKQELEKLKNIKKACLEKMFI